MICDGCGMEADARHIRERIERLELATRFRPIHIHALLIDAVPPARLADYFYQAARDRSARSSRSRNYFDQIVGLNRAAADAGIEEESALSEFQRRGLFLAYAVECPITDAATALDDTVRKLAPTVLKRVQVSYRPKLVALLSPEAGELIPALLGAGWGGRLVLDEGRPFTLPELGHTASPAGLADRLGARLVQAPAGLC
jgi:hypothetical protein